VMIGLLVDVRNRKRQPNFAWSELLWGSIAAAKTAPSRIDDRPSLDPYRHRHATALVVSTFWPYRELGLLVAFLTFTHTNLSLG